MEDNWFLAIKNLEYFPNTFLVLIASVPTEQTSQAVIEFNAQLDDCNEVLKSIYYNQIPVSIKETEKVIS